MRLGALVIAGGVLTLGGCIKRTEKITVLADGSVSLMTVIEGDPQDVRQGDAMPSEDSGWSIIEHIETDSDGDPKLTRTGVREFAAGDSLPDSYAALDDAVAAVALRFPTTLTIERRNQGTFYHFRRIYQRRAFNQAQYAEDQILESEPLKDLKKQDPAKLPEGDVRKLAEAFIEIDRLQTAGFIEQTALTDNADWPQDMQLAVRRAALRIYDDPKLIDLAVGVVEGPEEAAIADLEQRVRLRQEQAMLEAMQSYDLSEETAKLFVDQYQRMRRAFEISKDLDDEEWLVSVVMPGQIIGHNATEENLSPVGNDGGVRKMAISATYEVEQDGRRKTVTEVHEYESYGNSVAWEFNGKALHDRDVVLMATSFVPAAATQDTGASQSPESE